MSSSAESLGSGRRTPVAPPIMTMDLRSSLRCPLSGQELVDWVDDAGRPALASPTVGLVYPVRDGVPILLVHEALRTSVTALLPQS